MKGLAKYILPILFLSGCVHSSNNETKVSNGCISGELKSVIENYISETKTKLVNSKEFYYSTYFFEENGNNYFTIWVFNSFPNYIEDFNKDKVLKYYLFNLAEHNAILIADKNILEKNLLFSKCNEIIDIERIIAEDSNKIHMTYDGTWFPKTYKFEIQDKEIKIEEMEIPKVSFLGDDYIKFENYLKK